MMKIPVELQDLIMNLQDKITQRGRERTAEEAKKFPCAYKLSRVMPAGSSTNWRYLRTETPDGLGGRSVRFCWAVGRNVAGYFLGWREVINKDGTIKRDRLVSRKRKIAVREIAEQRQVAWNAKQHKESQL